MSKQAKFFVGQLVEHELFDYQGVIIDVDPYFMLTDEWYQLMAKSRPPKDHPWYRVLVHNSNHETYVAEQNLRIYPAPEPINHPDIDTYFSQFDGSKYLLYETKSN
ncbi:MAG: heat shock protein HspQ [Pseudomonadales bacterium]|nr:heat shock protein HspQ [Pseudomonadales bacterium]MCP5214188.1 heat shock protein HspQ [Pseudomonadales bacterium]MCP5302619.1 heat shock protein HspQ [Pseudomonadales bacterium]